MTQSPHQKYEVTPLQTGDMVQVVWRCLCGGNMKRPVTGTTFRMVPSNEVGYYDMLYPHRCDKCHVVSEARYQYPRLVLKADVVSE